MPRRGSGKVWSWSTGTKGRTVTVEERRPGGVIQGRAWDPTLAKYRRRSLGHRDRDQAKAWAIEQAARLQKAEDDLLRDEITWARLFAEYLRRKSLDKGEGEQAEDHRRVEMWTRILGATNDPHDIDREVWDRFTVERGKGIIDSRSNRVKAEARRPVRVRSVRGDLVWLREVCQWGATVKGGGKRYLLRENPVRGREFKVPRLNPRRPLANDDRFYRTLAVADQVQMRVTWFGRRYRVESYLKEWLPIAYDHGRRIGAICKLRQRDLHLDVGPYGAILWPEDTDKTGSEAPRPIPMTPEMREAIDSALAAIELGMRPSTPEGWLFPAPGDPTQPTAYVFADRQLEKAERLAGLPKLHGGLWHPYRRWFGTRNKTMPARDVEVVGGWAKNSRSLRECYQSADDDTILAVVMNGRRTDHT